MLWNSKATSTTRAWGRAGSRATSRNRRAGLLKLFKDETLRAVVLERLKEQLVEEGRCRPNPKIRLALACGHTKRGHRDALKEHFESNDWDLYNEEWLRSELRKVAKGGYDNRVRPSSPNSHIGRRQSDPAAPIVVNGYGSVFLPWEVFDRRSAGLERLKSNVWRPLNDGNAQVPVIRRRLGEHVTSPCIGRHADLTLSSVPDLGLILLARGTTVAYDRF